MFAMIESYKNILTEDDSHASGSQPSFCYMLGRENSHHNSTRYVNDTMSNVTTACIPVSSDVSRTCSKLSLSCRQHVPSSSFQPHLNSRVFINSIVIAVTGVIGYTLAGSLITVVGKKKLMGEMPT